MNKTLLDVNEFDFATDKTVLALPAEAEDTCEAKREFCSTCSVTADRKHYKTTWHTTNLSRLLTGKEALTYADFEALALESQSSSSSSSEEEYEATPQKPPYILFPLTSPPTKALKLLSCTLLTPTLPSLYLLTPTTKWFLLLFSSGSFSCALYTLSGTLLTSKSLKKYTIRKGQGGAQSTHDGQNKTAKSVGSQIRRENARVLEGEIREVLSLYSEEIQGAHKVFLRYPPPLKRVLFFEGSPLHATRDRNHGFPFSTGKVNATEIRRCFDVLRRVEVVDIPCEPVVKNEKTPVKEARKEKVKEVQPEKEVENPDVTKAKDLILKDKVDLLASHLQKTGLNLDEALPGSSVLHFAALSSAPLCVSYLLEQGLNPTLKDINQKRAYDLSSSKPTRDAFRRFWHTNPEKWDYSQTSIPSPLSSEQEEKQKLKKKERSRKVKASKPALISQPEEEEEETELRGKSHLSHLSKTQINASNMSAETRMRIDREKRAAAAERRSRLSKGLCVCGKSIKIQESYEKNGVRYCSMECLRSDSI